MPGRRRRVVSLQEGIMSEVVLLLLGSLLGCGGAGRDQADAIHIVRRADQCSDMPACTASSLVSSCPASFGSEAGEKWYKMDVWSGSRPFEPRYGHAVIDFFGQILVIGGLKVSSSDSAVREGMNDVWTLKISSSLPSAEIWRIKDDDNAGFLGRGLFASVAHADHKVYIFGGMTTGTGTANDAWRSGDGMVWENVQSPSSTARINSVLLSSAGRLFLIGGGDSDCDVRVSSKSDQIKWETASLPPGTKSLCGTSAGIVRGTRILVYSFRSDRIYAQILEWREDTASLSVLKSRWELTLGGRSSFFSGVGTAVLVGGTPYIVGSSGSTGRQRIYHAANGGVDTASAWEEKGGNPCIGGAWCDTSTGTAALYSDGRLCLSGGLKPDPQTRSLHSLGQWEQGARRGISGSSTLWCSSSRFYAPAVTFEGRNANISVCGDYFSSQLNASGFYMLCPEGQGGGAWSLISSSGTVPVGNGKITVYAKTQHTTDSWLTVTPSPISCGFIDAATSPPALLPSSPPPETPSPTPSPTPPPAPPPMVNGIDPCCDSFCDFSACQPNGVIDATGGSMVIVYGTGLLDARSIRIGGRECISASSTNMLECRPSSNYGALADSQCQCISPPGAGKQPAEVRGGSRGTTWTDVEDVIYGQVYASSFDLVHEAAHPAVGGGRFVVTGSGFGRRGARENSLYASLAGSEGVWGDFDGLAGRFSSRLEWVSETSVKGVVPAGVGAEVRVLLRLQTPGWSYSVPNSPINLVFSYSYEAPSITSIFPAANHQGLNVTILGRNFGAAKYSLGIYAVSVGGSSCSFVSWVSDSSLLCNLPEGRSGSNHSVEVTVAGQGASLPASFSYTGASQEYKFGTEASVAEASTSLKSWSEWIAGLINVSEEQVYARVIQGEGGRRQVATSVISVKFLGTRQEPNSFAAAEVALSTLLSDGKLQGSPVPLTFIQAGNRKSPISETPAPPLSGSGFSSPSSLGSSSVSPNAPGQSPIFVPVQSADSTSDTWLAIGVVCGVLAVVAAAYLLCRRIHDRHTQTEIVREEGVPEPSASSSSGIPSYINGSLSFLARPSGQVEVSPIGQHRMRRRQINLCDQCRRSGFAVCIHGVVEPEVIEVMSDSQVHIIPRGDLGTDAKFPPLDEDEHEEQCCVVCLDAPREAVVVHNDAQHTTHQVLCLDCAARIVGSGGACPMCRAPIFAILQARDSTLVPPSMQRGGVGGL